MEEFQRLLEEYLLQSEKIYRIGDRVEGVIVYMDDKNAYVDIGSKKEALLPLEELRDLEGNLLFKKGDKVSALIVKRLSGEASYLLSVRKILEEEARKEIKEAHEKGLPIKVKIINSVKGGFEVIYNGILQGFLPRSQYQEREGEEIYGLIQKIDNKSFVISPKAYYEKERELKVKELVGLIEKEGILEGTVKREVKGGYLIDFEGVLTGYLPYAELTRRRLSSYEGFLKAGDKIRVKVIEWNEETQKLRVSLKAFEPDPWDEVSLKYSVEQRVKGKVVRIMNFGAFIEIEPGLEGLLPASEISWKRGLKPKDVLSEGDMVEVVINEIEPTKKRMILSLKRLEENPWDKVAREIKPGDVIEGRVKTVTNFGMFIEVMEGVDGFIHISQVDWERVEDLHQRYRTGDMVRAKVIELNPENKRLLLSIKELIPDPWEELAKKIKIGDDLEGVIVGETKGQGYLVKISKGVVGFLPLKEVWEEDGKKKILKEGEVVKGKVIYFDPERRRLWLSEKAYFQEKEKEELSQLKENLKSSSKRLRDVVKLDLEEK
ncbi:MAG: S1 RNA-binding domain-containing protein [Caldimicrobium thiodismutans]